MEKPLKKKAWPNWNLKAGKPEGRKKEPNFDSFFKVTGGHIWILALATE